MILALLLFLLGQFAAGGGLTGAGPSIQVLSPTTGAAGISVTITGQNLGATQGSSTVTFNGVAATATSWSVSRVIVTVPFAASTGNVVMSVGGIMTNAITFTVSGGGTDYYTGTVRIAASCTFAAVNTAYGLTVNRDILEIPDGDCQTTNRWGNQILVTKSIMIRAAHSGTTTKIGISSGSSGFSFRASNIRVTGINFNCNFQDTTLRGPVQFGSLAGNPTWDYADFRVDHNTFDQCGAAGGDTTGRDAVSINGDAYGVIDHNTFNGCNGECIDICMDGVRSLTREIVPGTYTPGNVVFVEDNTFNHNTNVLYENIIDGNSGYRVVFRHNTVIWTNGARSNSGLISGHETCARCTSVIPSGDAGSLLTEIYENMINIGASASFGPLSTCRGGRCIIYNNHIVYTGSPATRFGGVLFSNYRSNHYTLNDGQCGSSTNDRGYSSYCHENQDVNNPEGATIGITTLNGTINASTTTVVLTSVAGLDTTGTANGFAVRIGTETICYTGISGTTLTGVTRGCYASTTNAMPSQVGASHTTGASVDYLKFGVCLEQPNNSYIWNNDGNGSVLAQANAVEICDTVNGSCNGFFGPDYTFPDIQSFAARPNNWQYQEGALIYTPYTYPHPLQSSTGPS